MVKKNSENFIIHVPKSNLSQNFSSLWLAVPISIEILQNVTQNALPIIFTCTKNIPYEFGEPHYFFSSKKSTLKFCSQFWVDSLYYCTLALYLRSTDNRLTLNEIKQLFNMQRIVFNMNVNYYILQTKNPPPKKNHLHN